MDEVGEDDWLNDINEDDDSDQMDNKVVSNGKSCVKSSFVVSMTAYCIRCRVRTQRAQTIEKRVPSQQKLMPRAS